MKRPHESEEPDAPDAAPDGEPGTPPPREEQPAGGKGAGSKHGTQRKPEDQKGRPDPADRE